MTRWHDPRALAVAAVILVGIAWGLRFAVLDHDTDPSVQRLQSAVAALHKNPAGGVASLPKGISTYYEPAAAGATELRGALYLRLSDGRCAVADVTISRAWLNNPNSGTFAVSGPQIRDTCPGS